MIDRNQLVAFTTGTAITAVVVAGTLTLRAQDKVGDAIVALEKRVVDLESRLARTADGGTRLRAPVEIVDSSGGRVARIYVASGGESLIEACRGLVCGASLETNSQGGLVRSSHESGRVLVGVSPDVPSAGVRVYGGSGPPKVEMSLNPATGNGYFHAGSTGGGWAQLAVATSGGYVAVSKVGGSPTGLSALSRDESGGPSTAELSGRNGRMALRINNPQGVQIAALGESPESPGSGALRIFSSAGQPQVSLDSLAGGGALNVFANSGKAPIAAVTSDAKSGTGIVAVYNRAGSALGALAQGANGGMLQLSDLSGTPMVEAGTATAGVGLVRTGPMLRAMLPGIPGSYILGKK